MFWQGIALGIAIGYGIIRLFDEDGRNYEEEIYEKGYEDGHKDGYNNGYNDGINKIRWR